MLEFIVIGAVIGAGVALILVIVRERARSDGGRGRGVRTFERERSIGYFQDLGGRGQAQGVQEEDRSGRWGGEDRGDETRHPGERPD